MALHSTMVRLKLSTASNASSTNAFTFHYGEIKTNVRYLLSSINLFFTFHYGEIKTTNFLMSDAWIFPLHSTMVRLKRLKKRKH